MHQGSPMMAQYRRIKEQHPDKLLFFQVGDFYELFYEDARTAARELEIALTSRGTEKGEPIPLAGVPMHAGENYINKVLKKGYKAVICEQTEDSSASKGLVKREITRILTPGTITDTEMLDESTNNYLAVIYANRENSIGMASVDITTGEFRATEKSGADALDYIKTELSRINPAECLCSSEILANQVKQLSGFSLLNKTDIIPFNYNLEEVKNIVINLWGAEIWEDQKLDSFPAATTASAMAVSYLNSLHHPTDNNHYRSLDIYFSENSLIIDHVTSRNLELTRSYRENSKQGSLLGLIDYGKTAMGKRLLKSWLEQPLRDHNLINQRLDAVEELICKPFIRHDLRNILADILDIERFCSKLIYRRVNARDMIALNRSLQNIKPLTRTLSELNAVLIRKTLNEMPDFTSLIRKIEQALSESAPMAIKEGGIFKDGYNEEIDRLRSLANDASQWLLEYEQDERKKTGIKTLRVGYNRNFGHYIEVTKTNSDLVPEYYHRKQTLVNAERYTTDELRRMENEITGSRERLINLEHKLFEEFREEIITFLPELQNVSHKLGFFDCMQSLAELAENNRYCRPVVENGIDYLVVDARHPVVEKLGTEKFVPNNIEMDKSKHLLVITGPNMAGKSTYIRTAALLTILAQMGSFIPAAKAELPIIDRVFARIGASDDISSGHSTFMVEMQETSAILREATANSLLILDEIGRGTSTYDGMSLARSVIEYICANIKALTLFSTHYHELTGLEGEIKGIKNYTIAVREKGSKVIFLRKIVEGKADKSYGINVARLAGVPTEVLVRAEEILAELETAGNRQNEQQLSLLPYVKLDKNNNLREKEVLNRIKELDINHMTPLEAIKHLYTLQKELLEEKDEDNGEI